jgi:hypothetical protein
MRASLLSLIEAYGMSKTNLIYRKDEAFQMIQQQNNHR